MSLLRVEAAKVAAHSIKSITLGPVVLGSSRIAWRDLFITDEEGRVSLVELFASGADFETLTARLRVVGDPPVEVPLIAPVAEPVLANDYVEGDAC